MAGRARRKSYDAVLHCGMCRQSIGKVEYGNEVTLPALVRSRLLKHEEDPLHIVTLRAWEARRKRLGWLERQRRRTSGTTK